MTNMTLELAQKAIDKALDLAKNELDGRPLSIAVCDKDGFLVAFAKMDGAKLLTIELTYRKAYTAARMGVPTDSFLARLQNDNLNIAYFGDPKFTAMPGGSPVYGEGKTIIGAVGVGGITVQLDKEIAERAAAAISI